MVATPRENAALVRGFLTDVVSGGDTDAVSAFLAAGDVDITIDDVVAATDQVAVLGTVTGTHCESLMDLAPTARSFEIACAWFCRIEDGQIAAIYSLPDGLGLMQQVDAIPDWTTNRSLSEPTEYP